MTIDPFSTPKKPYSEEPTLHCQECVHWGASQDKRIRQVEVEYSKLFENTIKRCEVWGTFASSNTEACGAFEQREMV